MCSKLVLTCWYYFDHATAGKDASLLKRCIRMQQAVFAMPKQEAVAWAVEQINIGNLAGAKQLLDALLALPVSKFGKQERLGAYLARGHGMGDAG